MIQEVYEADPCSAFVRLSVYFKTSFLGDVGFRLFLPQINRRRTWENGLVQLDIVGPLPLEEIRARSLAKRDRDG